MSDYLVKKLNRTEEIVVSVPGSKSITNRALLLSALAEGESVLHGVLFSNDSRVFMDSLIRLGFLVNIDEENNVVRIKGEGGRIPALELDGEALKKDLEIFVGSAGTAARFLTAFCALGSSDVRLSSTEQMAKRPMDELYSALESIGCSINREGENLSFPVVINGEGLRVDDEIEIELNIDRSSQFLSACLMVLPLKYKKVRIKLTGNRKAKSYVRMTEQMMVQFGFSGEIKEINENLYEISGGSYSAQDYNIEPDISAACYFYGIAALCNLKTTVSFVRRDSLQGDMKFLEVLEKMGCKLEWGDSLSITGPEGRLKGIRADFQDFSDQALTIAAIAPFASESVEIYNIGHIRKQESDRLNVIITNLRALGVECACTEDSFIVYPKEDFDDSLVKLDTFDDHRVAMSFTLTGLKRGNIIIQNADCCKKTFENYFEIIDKLY